VILTDVVIGDVQVLNPCWNSVLGNWVDTDMGNTGEDRV
jgi:hypothetical protein